MVTEVMTDRLSIRFCGLKFQSPFVLAASPCTDELEMVQNAFRAGWAGAVLKTTHTESIVYRPVSPLLWGNDFEDKKVVGLGNIDVRSKYHVGIVEERVHRLKQEFPDKIVIASVGGNNRETAQQATERLVRAGVDAIECAPGGCPQDVDYLHKSHGRSSASEEDPYRMMVTWVKQAAGKVPLIIKVEGEAVADALKAQEAGADAVVVGGGRTAVMGVDLDTFVPYPSVAGKSTYAGYTGPIIKPLTLGLLCKVRQAVQLPLAASGGAMTWLDALEFICLGATTVQFATAVMRNGFRIIDDLMEGVETYLEEKEISSASNLVGKALPNLVTQNELSQEYQLVSSVNRDACIKCDLCYIACRDGGHMAIELGEDRIPKVDEKKCVGCGLCRCVCPVWDCITLKPNEAI